MTHMRSDDATIIWPDKSISDVFYDLLRTKMSHREYMAEYLNVPNPPEIWKIEDGVLIIYRLNNMEWVEQILNTYEDNDEVIGVLFIVDPCDMPPNSTTWAKFFYGYLRNYPKPIKTHCPAIDSVMTSRSYAQACHELGITIGKTAELATAYAESAKQLKKHKPLPQPKSKFHK